MKGVQIEKIIDGHTFIATILWEDSKVQGTHLACLTCDPHGAETSWFPVENYEEVSDMVSDVDVAARLHAATESAGLV